MVSPGHAGMVEEGGEVGLAGVVQDEIFGGGVEVRSIWETRSARIGDRGVGTVDSGMGGCTGCYPVEALEEEAVILSPGHVKPLS